MRLPAILLPALLVLAAPVAALEPENVLVVINEESESSAEVAAHYLKFRSIPEANIVRVKCSTEEETTREDFDKNIRPAIHDKLISDTKITTVLLMWGVPLKIAETNTENDGEGAAGRDLASVDSELMLGRSPPFPPEGANGNPLFDTEDPIDPEKTPISVCRIDGPSVEIVKDMIERTIIAEALGPAGESLLDTRGTNLGASETERNDTMKQVAELWRDAGLSVHHDDEAAVVDLSSHRLTLHYVGWSAAGQVPAGDPTFRTGAIAMHLHDESASSIRNADAHWVGPMLSWGATAAIGTANQAYLMGFPREDIFWDRLLNGFSFGEAAIYASRLVSWQAVFVGDPLYTPYPKEFADLHTERRELIAAALAGGDKDEDAPELAPLLKNCVELLRHRAEAIQQGISNDPMASLQLLNKLRVTVKDMGLDEWLAMQAEPFSIELKKLFDRMKADFKEDIWNTSRLEDALRNWKGLPIYAEIEAFEAEVAKKQEKKADGYLKKARANLAGRKYMAAWMLAAEAKRHHFSSASDQAGEVLDEIRDSDQYGAVCEAAETELAKLVAKARKNYDKEKYDKARKELWGKWDLYPECESRDAALALMTEIEARLEEEAAAKEEKDKNK